MGDCPTRKLYLRQDIYSFCWTICLSAKEQLAVGKISEKQLPTEQQTNQVILTMLFCSAAQILVSVLILLQVGNNSFGTSVGFEIQLVRFICCSMFHFWFAKKVEVGLRSMKYTAMHLSKFKHQQWAFVTSTLQLLIILLIEVVNILNLCQLSTCMDILINYIALGFVSEFSTHFIEPFKSSEMASLIGAVLPFENFRNIKVIVD